jgi:hypothetical protein
LLRIAAKSNKKRFRLFDVNIMEDFMAAEIYIVSGFFGSRQNHFDSKAAQGGFLKRKDRSIENDFG